MSEMCGKCDSCAECVSAMCDGKGDVQKTLIKALGLEGLIYC
jgi:hypothetical protein